VGIERGTGKTKPLRMFKFGVSPSASPDFYETEARHEITHNNFPPKGHSASTKYAFRHAHAKSRHHEARKILHVLLPVAHDEMR